MEEPEARENRTGPIPPEADAAEPTPEAFAAGESAGAGPADPDGREAEESGGSESLRRALEESRARVTELERERLLLSRGVPEEDLDYYVFKIGKLVTEEKDFAAAAAEFLKRHALRQPAPVSTGASLSGRTARTQTANETMNRLIRGE